MRVTNTIKLQIIIAAGIQKGESIQNQDQDIKSHNFRTINTIPNI